MTAEIGGDFVLFLIGMRVNRPLKIHKWLPITLAMGRMVRELEEHPEWGCLATQARIGVAIQYWRSFAQLEAYAQSADGEHLPAWKAFNQKVRASSGVVGIWHETYLIRQGNCEAMYVSMPRFGLAAAGCHVPVGASKDSARQRLADAS